MEKNKEQLHLFLIKSIDKSFQAKKRLYKKCIKRGFSEKITNNELNNLEKLGLINDKKLANLIANTLYYNSGFVGYPLFIKLLARDLPYEIAKQATNDIKELGDEIDVATKQIEFFNLENDIDNSKAYNKLKRKGFSSNTINSIVSKNDNMIDI